MGCSYRPNGATIFMLQGGRDLEEHVKEFVGVSHLAQCNDIALMKGFWIELDDEMPRGNTCWTLAEYINFALWVSGSSFTLGKVEEDPAASVQYHSLSITTPEPEPATTPTVDTESEPTTERETQPLPATDIMRED